MKKKNDHTVGTIIKILEIGKIDTPNTTTFTVTFLAWYMQFNKKVVGLK